MSGWYDGIFFLLLLASLVTPPPSSSHHFLTHIRCCWLCSFPDRRCTRNTFNHLPRPYFANPDSQCFCFLADCCERCGHDVILRRSIIWRSSPKFPPKLSMRCVVPLSPFTSRILLHGAERSPLDFPSFSRWNGTSLPPQPWVTSAGLPCKGKVPYQEDTSRTTFTMIQD